MRTIAFPYANHCVRIYERFGVDLDPSHRFKTSLTQCQNFSPAILIEALFAETLSCEYDLSSRLNAIQADVVQVMGFQI